MDGNCQFNTEDSTMTLLCTQPTELEERQQAKIEVLRALLDEREKEVERLYSKFRELEKMVDKL